MGDKCAPAALGPSGYDAALDAMLEAEYESREGGLGESLDSCSLAGVESPWPSVPRARHARHVSSVERLSAEDRLILWPDAIWPQDIGALGVLEGSSLLESEGRFCIEAAKQAIEHRLHLLPRFRQVLYVPRRGLGGPLWIDAPAFDLNDHSAWSDFLARPTRRSCCGRLHGCDGAHWIGHGHSGRCGS